MPGFNGTGPFGGRGLGPCGRGLAFRGGFGTGFRRFAQVPAQLAQGVQPFPYTREQERADLKAEKELLERDLKAIEERIKELEKKQ